MIDLKILHSVLVQFEEERGISQQTMKDALELALATAYKKEFGKRGQIIRCAFSLQTGEMEFYQVKTAVDETFVKMDDDIEYNKEDTRPKFNPEHHILIEDARRIKKNIELGEELIFPVDQIGDFGRIAAQTAKQVILQKMREAERAGAIVEFSDKEGKIVRGTVQRFERGNLYVDLGRAIGVLTYEEQIPGERYSPGDRIVCLLKSVNSVEKQFSMSLSRACPEFLIELFKQEAPEVKSGLVQIKSVAREAGSRSKIAVWTEDEFIDPVGSCVGQRGVRVNTVSNELNGEKIDIIEWSSDAEEFIDAALSPAECLSLSVDEETHTATAVVNEEQQSLAIGKGGQNVRLAAKLTGWKIEVFSQKKDTSDVIIHEEEKTEPNVFEDTLKELATN